jgi:hypothetical protein
MNCSYSEFIQKLNESGNRYDYRSITLLNDSILMYGKLYGRIGVSTKYKYTLINNNTLVVDSLDIFGRIRPLNESFESIWNLDSLDVGGIIKEISGDRFLYSHDSLINKETGEIYYDKEKWEKRIK